MTNNKAKNKLQGQSDCKIMVRNHTLGITWVPKTEKAQHLENDT